MTSDTREVWVSRGTALATLLDTK
ncbi:Protein of unknown function [Pyronema omphalodes CBS 100304]|uniref:Uncharacterized protein n=1 Tax=Pyronema omphalodes (strain CBS 100304) TaxID=1076935 RepID=U4LI30_PYROM|nr:Protein of unknown function [Pyronema omphalodes CBS 100304]